jgi:hypothetical protein
MVYFLGHLKRFSCDSFQYLYGSLT